MFDRKTIERLESSTPLCSHCGSRTQFIIGCGYRFVRCDDCSQVDIAPIELTQAIVDAYDLPVKNITQKRLQPRILQV